MAAVIRPHLEYLRYVLRHKWFVFLACRKLKVPLWQSIVHDWSKLTPCEWLPYVRKFYGEALSVGDEIDSVEFGRGKITRKRDVCLVEVSGDDPKWPGGVRDLSFEHYTNLTVQWAFDHAWNHHQKRNKHHWQYWFLMLDSGETRVLEMPERYVREMVSDWVGAGRAITGKIEVRAWYRKNAEKMALHSRTRLRVESLIMAFDDITVMVDET